MIEIFSSDDFIDASEAPSDMAEAAYQNDRHDDSSYQNGQGWSAAAHLNIIQT
jgi:hypothetical protein